MKSEESLIAKVPRYTTKVNPRWIASECDFSKAEGATNEERSPSAFDRQPFSKLWKRAFLIVLPQRSRYYLERSCNASSVHYLIGGDGNDFD